MGLPIGRVNARSGRVCMFVCANVHAPFLSKAPYLTFLGTVLPPASTDSKLKVYSMHSGV